MSMLNDPSQGSKTRLRVSGFILASLFVAKLMAGSGQTSQPISSDSSVAQTDDMGESFEPVTQENADTWSLMGSMLNLFSGGRQSSSESHRQVEDDKARQAEDDSRFMNRKWKEDEEQRRHDADNREQEMREMERQRQQDSQYE